MRFGSEMTSRKSTRCSSASSGMAELVDDAEVRHSGDRCHRLHAVVGAARLHGKFVTVNFHQDTPFLLRIARAMAFSRSNGRTPTVTAQTANAANTLSLRVCLCFSSQPSSQGDDGGYLFHDVYFPLQLGTGKPCVHISRPPPSPEGGQLRTGKSDVYQQPIASAVPTGQQRE